LLQKHPPNSYAVSFGRLVLIGPARAGIDKPSHFE
jgi:hypothetical protein